MSENTGSLPACGQTCFSNLLSIANTQFDCTPGDTACYCSTPQFSSGVKDCAAQACSSSDAQAVSAYLDQFCAGVSITSSGLPESLSSAIGGPSTAESASSFQVTPVSSVAGFTPSSALPTSDQIPSLATSSSTSTSTSTSTESSGLSSNAKIGLAAGIPCGVILLFLVGFGAFWFGKRKAKAGMRTSAESSSNPPHRQVWERPEMDGNEVRRQELETQANRAELPGKSYRDEKDVKVVV